MKKSLGQHFIVNKAAIQKIIAALDLKEGETIIEIGPGSGALTLPLAEKCEKLNCKIIAIEKDPKLAFSVQRTANSENLEIVIGDALKELPKITQHSTLTAKRFKVVGNIPYYITGKLLRILSELEKKPEISVLMVQKEVAERIVAKPPKNNLLAAAVQFWAEPKILFKLKPADFNPPPKVDSAVIKFETRDKRYEKRDRTKIDSYYKLLRIIFKQPRKTLVNNLKDGTDLSREDIETLLSGLKIDQKSRPQDLDIEKIEKLAGLINI